MIPIVSRALSSGPITGPAFSILNAEIDGILSIYRTSQWKKSGEIRLHWPNRASPTGNLTVGARHSPFAHIATCGIVPKPHLRAMQADSPASHDNAVGNLTPDVAASTFRHTSRFGLCNL